ncbi:MAG: tRNA epoxyqueuosine(34) reductase QueG [Rhodocyclaceae bacterium]|nr:tRNA epoxyqueuosine(34) reductase QueG [Rhodocyclaceae bacterium]
MHDRDWAALAAHIKVWGRELGFDAIGIADANLGDAERGLAAWLAAGCHGEMDYMASHGAKRARPAELVPGTQRVIVARMTYLPTASARKERPAGCPPAAPICDNHEAKRAGTLPAAASADEGQARAQISRYAQGRDYHKLLRQRLQKLADRMTQEIGPFGHRVFTDSAPVMEVELAARAGLGWRGKHTLLLTRDAGSWFFLGEIFVALPLPVDAPTTDHCGTCRACLDACPTGAIVAPYRVDARRCISYLTIELKGSIPLALRAPIGSRVYGCDDCQLCCPWNRAAPTTREEDFAVRHGLDRATLVELFAWSAAEFETKLAGSAIRRIGYERWLRNLAVGLGNAATTPAVITALETRRDDPSALVREHVLWALGRHHVRDR